VRSTSGGATAKVLFLLEHLVRLKQERWGERQAQGLSGSPFNRKITGAILPVSARDMDDAERRYYERQK
jgi:hypothetical protein